MMKNIIMIVSITTAIMIDDKDVVRVKMIMTIDEKKNKTILTKTQLMIKIKTIITVI